jgi:hypothetical protein
MNSRSGPGRAASTNDYEGDGSTTLPHFGSDEHVEWIARRMSRNLRFRADVERWTALSLRYRRPVREAWL